MIANIYTVFSSFSLRLQTANYLLYDGSGAVGEAETEYLTTNRQPPLPARHRNSDGGSPQPAINSEIVKR